MQEVGLNEKIWGWVREEATANTCFGTRAPVRAAVDRFFGTLSHRAEEVSRRCRTILQSEAAAHAPTVAALLQDPQHVDPILALV